MMDFDKSDTDSDKGDDLYDDMVIHKQIQQMFSEEWWWWILGFLINSADFSTSYMQVWLQGSL